MNRRKKILREHICFLLAIAVYLLSGVVFFGGCCPVRLLLHIECPFCGMTTAYLRFIRGDINGALKAHSLFYLGVPFVWIIAHFEILKKKTGLFPYIIAALIITALAVRYLLRIRFGEVFL